MRKISYIFLVFIVASCAIKSRKEQKDLRGLLKQGEFTKAQTLLDDSTIKTEEKNKLLYLMESASIKYAQKKYKQAAVN